MLGGQNLEAHHSNQSTQHNTALSCSRVPPAACMHAGVALIAAEEAGKGPAWGKSRVTRKCQCSHAMASLFVTRRKLQTPGIAEEHKRKFVCGCECRGSLKSSRPACMVIGHDGGCEVAGRTIVASVAVPICTWGGGSPDSRTRCCNLWAQICNESLPCRLKGCVTDPGPWNGARS